MEERIGSHDIWDNHGCRLSCKVLEIIEDTSHVEQGRRCVIWEHDHDSRQGPIGHTLLPVDDDRSEGVRDFLGAHGTACGREDLLTVDAAAEAVGGAKLRENTLGRW